MGEELVPEGTSTFKVELKAIIIDPSADRVDRFLAGVQPELEFEAIDSANNIFNAIQAFMETRYSVCFMSNHVPFEEARTFIADVAKMGGRGPVLFVALHDAQKPAYDAAGLKELGCKRSIPFGLSGSDKIELAGVLREFISGPYQTGSKIDNYADWMLKEIDRVYYQKKRGLPAELKNIVSGHVRESMEKDITLSSTFFDSLTEKAETVEVPLPTVFDVPEEVVKKNLPELNKLGYGGVSERVFRKISSKFGRKKKA